ncbi:MAG: hypothetical protein SF029_11425 [bacterium]|nr:hypothetical protein [bacterium]
MGRRIEIPGMVDPHTHLRGMAWSHKATFASETAAAVAGGYWAVFDMPNTPPSTVSRAALDYKLSEISAQAVCDWGVYFGASQQENQAKYSGVVADVCGLKMFCNQTTGDLLIDDPAQRERHIAAWPGEKVISVHAEGNTVDDILALAKKYHKRVHFLHISTAYEIERLAAAKEAGLPITIGICPHHLWLTEEDLPVLRAFGLMKPELKTKADQAALWRALQMGIVDAVESDHAPHTITEKQSEEPPYGVPGLETTLPLLLTAVHEGRLTLDAVVGLVADNPRRIFGLTCPPETYAVVDLDAAYTIERSNLRTACGWSPFEGMRVQGKVVETWIRGRRVYDGERVLAEAGDGRNLYG